MGKSSSPPPAPDYTGAANATAAGNADAARIAVKGNRINQNTPYGSITYTNGINGDQDQWMSDISLSPTGSQLLDLSNQAATSYGQQAVSGLGRLNEGLSQPFDYGSVGDVQDASYQAQTARLDPQWQQNDAAMESKLRNQGIPVGSEAWGNEYRTFNQAKNDAYSQARQNAISTAPQTFQLAQALRNQPLNEVNALRTGSQVTIPQFSPPGQQNTTAGPNALGAAQAQGQYSQGMFNADQASNNATMNGLFSLGAAAIPLMFSDRRLKSNISRIGTHPLGIGIYEYDIFGERQTGVMADEVERVRPDAVAIHPSGYKMVNYGALS